MAAKADEVSSQTEVDALKQQLAVLNKKCGDIQTSGIAAKAARDKLISELEVNAALAASAALASHSKDAEMIRKLQVELSEKDNNIAVLTSKIGEVEKQIEIYSTMALQEKSGFNQREKDLKASVKISNDELAAMTKKQTDLMVEIAVAKANEIDSRRAIEHLKQQLDGVNDEYQRMAARNKLNSDEIASLHEHLDEANQRLNAQVSENGILAATLSGIRKLETQATLEEERRRSDLESRHMVYPAHLPIAL